MTHDVEVFLACGALAADLIGHERTAASWHEPSALAGYDVAGLAGHLARGVLTVGSYLQRPATGDGDLIDAAGYLAGVLGDEDPVDSDLHRAIRQRSVDAAADGPAALAAEVRAAAAGLATSLADTPLDAVVQVRDGLRLRLADYLATRVVELVVHLDDLAVSLGVAMPEVPPAAYDVTAAVLARTAVARVGGLTAVRALARAERHPGPLRAL